MTGFVYFIRCQQYVKIGWSKLYGATPGLSIKVTPLDLGGAA